MMSQNLQRVRGIKRLRRAPISVTVWTLASVGFVSGCAPALVESNLDPMPGSTDPAIGQSGTRHQYRRVDQSDLTFDQAKDAAAAMTFNSMPGHLAIFETKTYDGELTYIHDNVYAPGVVPTQLYWIGANRPVSTKDRNLDWNWVDGTAVPPSIASTWFIDFMEGPVPEGVGFFGGLAGKQLGDYSVANPGRIVGGYIIEFESAEAAPR